MRLARLFICFSFVIFSVLCQQATILYYNDVATGILTSTTDRGQWVISVPLDASNRTRLTSVTVFALASSSPPPTVAFTLSLESNISYEDPNALGSAVTPDQSFIIPYQRVTDAQGDSLDIYITVQALDMSLNFTYTISTSIVEELINPIFTPPSQYQTYRIHRRVNTGQRLYYYFNSDDAVQLLIEECGSYDDSGNQNPVSAAFLFNTTTDQLPEYNQSYVDSPCGDGVPGYIVVDDPTNDKDSRYLKICPTIVRFSTGFNSGPTPTVIGIDVLRFWQAPRLSGYIDFSMTIYTNPANFVKFPLQPAEGSPSFVQVAPFTVDDSDYPDAVFTFTPLKNNSNGQILDGIKYGIVTDIAFDSSIRDHLVANSSFSSGCFLEINEAQTLWNNTWFEGASLSLVETDSYQIRAPGFFKNFPTNETVPFHMNILANSQDVFGLFAYEFVEVDGRSSSSSDSRMKGWAVFLIVLASFVAVFIVVGIIVVAGVFLIQYRKKASYQQVE